MRKISLLILLASCAGPVFAAAQEDNGRAERRAARQAAAEQGEDGRERPVRATREQRGDTTRPEGPRATGERSFGGAMSPGTVDTVSNWRRAQRDAARSSEAAAGGTGITSGALAPRQRRIRTIPETSSVTMPQGGSVKVANRRDYRDGQYSRWSRDSWRRDDRYDWRRYRNSNWSLFRLGSYYDPFGWNYSRHSIGWYMYPTYYSARYWLSDPWQYRLPPVYGPYRWIRYWDDALLVNIYTGEVVDVLHNFFW